VRALHERDPGQAAEAEHPDSERNDPEHGQEDRNDGSTTHPAGPAAVAGDEDGLVMLPHAKGRLLECRHGLAP